MSEPTVPRLGRWRYGLHPSAAGKLVRSLDRVELPLGEALRLMLVEPDRADVDSVDVQYVIDTASGPWALWVSGPPEDVEACEAELREIVAPFPSDPQDQPPTRRDRRAFLAGWDDPA